MAVPGSRAGAQASPALSLAEVRSLRQSGVSPRRIAQRAREYCIAFRIVDSVERQLLAPGEDPALLEGLRAACVRMPTVLAPGVIADDDFTSPARFTSTDGMCVMVAGADGMVLENRRTGTGCAIPYAERYPGAVRLEVRFRDLVGDGGPGVLVLGFGKDSSSWDQQTFGVTSGGDVESGEIVNGQFRRLRMIQRARTAMPGAEGSVLAVEIRGRAVRLFVDGREVHGYDASRPLGSQVSLGVGARSRVRLTRLTVRELTGTASR